MSTIHTTAASLFRPHPHPTTTVTPHAIARSMKINQNCLEMHIYRFALSVIDYRLMMDSIHGDLSALQNGDPTEYYKRVISRLTLAPTLTDEEEVECIGTQKITIPVYVNSHNTGDSIAISRTCTGGGELRRVLKIRTEYPLPSISDLHQNVLQQRLRWAESIFKEKMKMCRYLLMAHQIFFGCDASMALNRRIARLRPYWTGEIISAAPLLRQPVYKCEQMSMDTMNTKELDRTIAMYAQTQTPTTLDAIAARQADAHSLAERQRSYHEVHHIASCLRKAKNPTLRATRFLLNTYDTVRLRSPYFYVEEREACMKRMDELSLQNNQLTNEVNVLKNLLHKLTSSLQDPLPMERTAQIRMDVERLSKDLAEIRTRYLEQQSLLTRLASHPLKPITFNRATPLAPTVVAARR